MYISASTEWKKTMAHRKGEKFTHIEGLAILDASLNKCILSEREWAALSLIREFTETFADHFYPVYRHVYDEDAGVMTDYGRNEQARTWANLHFKNSMSLAIQDVEETEKGVSVLFLGGLGAAFAQALFVMCSSEGPAEQIYRTYAEYLWEDEYLPDCEKESYITKIIESVRIDIKMVRTLSDKIISAKDCGRVEKHLKIEE